MSSHGNYRGQGAGVLLQAQDTGRVLLVLRSPLVNTPNTWASIGGTIDPGEAPQETAERELYEEAQLRALVDPTPLFIFDDGRFRYYNFIGYVDCEVEPVLNWESSAWRWFDPRQLPSNLHPGMKTMFENVDIY
jgi:8-oxo-dGTP pyrophosphatase MutT (NUDIX family)